ncbi:hypothetical protein QWY93_04745 [Echinicola jeungdonensis]|uniref:Uncharacterized protein n=1 Tax=Echinicola jeungdonensis TaxID=709343 RepID=A0ABV5J5K2_9BACT|nr:hypothetical protein [Echinicola jeungdonensis]MDN3668631.1 hypothetical protein [Echinicola jeungdonensis]
MLVTFSTALTLFTAYILGVISLFSIKYSREGNFLKLYILSGAIAGGLTFAIMYFFIQ